MNSTWITDSVRLAYDRSTGDEHQDVRALLRELVHDTVGSTELELATEPAGRPYLVGEPELAISLSHEDGWVAAALAIGEHARVGVDVQVPVPDTDPLLIARCCGGSTLATMPGPERDTEFAWIWTVQEACVKAEGTGLAGLPWTIRVPVGGTTGRWGDYRWRSLRGRTPVPISCAYREGK